MSGSRVNSISVAAFISSKRNEKMPIFHWFINLCLLAVNPLPLSKSQTLEKWPSIFIFFVGSLAE